MIEWWKDWSFIWFLVRTILIVGLILGGLTYWVVTAPKGCHLVYVQTTPVDGRPAMERVTVCDAAH